MRRPLCYSAAAAAFETAVFYFLGAPAAVMIIVLCGVSAVVLCSCAGRIKSDYREDGRRPLTDMVIVVMASLVCAFCNMCSYTQNERAAEKMFDSVSEVSGTVLQRSDRTSASGSSYVRYTVSVSEVNGKSYSGRLHLIVNDYSENAEGIGSGPVPGNKMTAAGECSRAQGRRNPGCFDYERHLKASGISGVMTAAVSVEDDSTDLRSFLYHLKQDMTGYIKEYSDEETAAMVSGIMFGDKSMMDEDTLETFQKNGTAHILAVSGIHIGMIYGFLSFLWIWRKGRMFFCTMSAFFICYVILADFSPSVIRAVVMIEAHIFATVTNRRYDLDSAAFLTALGSMFMNPMQIFHTGFQMSYLAVLTLSLVLPYIHRFYTGVLSAGAAVQAGLLPYIMYVFNYVSLISLIVNVPVIMLAGFIVPLGLISAVFSMIYAPLMAPAAGLLRLLCRALTWLNDMTCADGVTVFDVRSPDIRLVTAYYVMMFLFMSETGRLLFMRHEKNILILCVVLVFTVVQISGMCCSNKFRKADLVFVDVGQGACVHLRTSGGDYMVDGGGSINYDMGKKTLKPYLLKNGVRKLDGAFVTHLHTDHYKGIAELCRQGMVRKLYIYEGNRGKEAQLTKDTGLSSGDIVYIRKGQRIILGDDTYVDVLWPEGISWDQSEAPADITDEDENAYSLIMKIVHEGKSVMITGDIDSDCHEMLAGMYGGQLSTDILQVAHHGSRYSFSSRFIDEACPSAAVFQVGKNNYGHPNEGVISEYRSRGMRIFRNDQDGAVGFRWSRGSGIGTMTVR